MKLILFKSMKHLIIELLSRTFCQIFLRLISLITLFFATYYFLKVNFFLAIFTYYLYCISWNFLGWAGLGHEMVHMNPFKSKKLNKFFLILCGVLTLSNWNLFSKTHFLHHKDPHGKYDFESPSKFGSQRLIKYQNSLLNFIFDFCKFKNTFKYLFLNSSKIVPKKDLELYLKKRKIINSVAFSSKFILLYVFIIFSLSFYLKNSLPIFILFLPNFMGTNLVKNFARLQHPSHGVLKSLGINSIKYKGRDVQIEEFDKDFLENNLDMKLPNIISFLYSNMNFHATHHLNINVPFYKLKHQSDNNYYLGKVGLIRLNIKNLIKLNLRTF